MCNLEQCGKEGVLWGDIGIYPAQRWVPPETGRPKPSLKGKQEVSRGKGEAGRPESTENVVVGWLGVQAFWHS